MQDNRASMWSPISKGRTLTSLINDDRNPGGSLPETQELPPAPAAPAPVVPPAPAAPHPARGPGHN